MHKCRIQKTYKAPKIQRANPPAFRANQNLIHAKRASCLVFIFFKLLIIVHLINVLISVELDYY